MEEHAVISTWEPLLLLRSRVYVLFFQTETREFPFQRGFPLVFSPHKSPYPKLTQVSGNLSIDIGRNRSVDSMGLDRALGNFVTNVGLGSCTQCLYTHVNLWRGDV